MSHGQVEVPLWAHEWNQEVLAVFFDTPQWRTEGVSEEACRAVAKDLLNTEDLRHADHQGAASFTLISLRTGKVVQFRRKPLDETMLALARLIYGDLTPRIIRSEREFPLPIYIIDVVRGVDFTNSIPPPADRPLPVDKYYRGVISLARFIGKSAHFPQPACQPNGWTMSATALLDCLLVDEALAKAAPEVLPVIQDARQHAQLLDTLPIVLTHSDLGAVNMFLNEDGSISGVIDWDNACIEAFGMTIWSLYEDFLSHRQGNTIFFYDETTGSGNKTVRKVLEEPFWKELWASTSGILDEEKHGAAVRTSMTIGAITRYLDLDILEDIKDCGGQSGDDMACLVRAKGFLTALPRIMQ